MDQFKLTINGANKYRITELPKYPFVIQYNGYENSDVEGLYLASKFEDELIMTNLKTGISYNNHSKGILLRALNSNTATLVTSNITTKL